MKVQYFGDVHDFRKYVLLRLLAKNGFKIGVCWMLTLDDGRNDGLMRAYLKQREPWTTLDEQLFETLHEALIVRSTQEFVIPTIKHLQTIENAGLIPNAIYYEDFVPQDKNSRQSFHQKCLDEFASKQANLVFFDPDNGMEVKSCPKGRKNSVKYVYHDEFCEHYEQGRSLLIYQHFPFQQRDEFIATTTQRLSSLCETATVTHFRTPNVAYFAVIQPEHKHMFQATKTCVQKDISTVKNFFWTEDPKYT